MSVFGICVFLWLADIVENLSSLMFCVSSGGLICWFLYGFVSVGGENDKDSILTSLREFVSKGKKIAVILVFLFLCTGIIPSKQTVYMIGGTIAGSEIMGKITESKEYQKLMELFNLALDKQIKQMKEN